MINKQIENAIELLADRGVIFSVQDVAAYTSLEGLEDVIETALRWKCVNKTILSIDEQQNDAASSPRYLKTCVVEKWWVHQTVRWAEAGLNYLPAAQLAHSMSSAFLALNERVWDAPPPSLLAVGHRWAMVDTGCVTGTFVFPWASILRFNPEFIEIFRSIFNFELSPPTWLDDLSLNTSVEEALSVMCNKKHLHEQEYTIIRGRFGIDTGQKATLEQLGERCGISRERVRQIEKRALNQLRHSSFFQHLWSIFAADFIRSGGSLLIAESSMTPHRRLLMESIGLKAAHIPELRLHVIETGIDLAVYHNILCNVNSYLGFKAKQTYASKIETLQFLSRDDDIRIHAAEEKCFAAKISKTRPAMLREALRSLGRAAHYEEIAQECNELFPENQTSARNWHAALSWKNSIDLGIVWIGSKGRYGLKEHGYSRPSTDFLDAVSRIVKSRFSENRQPVSVDFVEAELSKHRREVNRNSIMIALGINDRLEDVGGGKYVPRSHDLSEKPNETLRSSYDVDAAFEAFQADDMDSDL